MDITPIEHNNAGSANGGILDGMVLPIQAFRFMLSRPRMILLALAPLTLNLILFTGLLIWGFTGLSGGLSDFLETHTAWYWSALAFIAKVLFWPLVLIIVYFIFTPIALLLGAPFHDYLSEKTEEALGITPIRDEPLFISLSRDVIYAMFSASQRLLYAGVMYLPILLLNLLPLIGSVLFLGASLYWTWRWSAFEFISYASDRHRLTWKQIWALLNSRRAFSLGFGIAAGSALAIPFLNALAVPVLSVAGAMLFQRLQSQ